MELSLVLESQALTAAPAFHMTIRDLDSGPPAISPDPTLLFDLITQRKCA